MQREYTWVYTHLENIRVGRRRHEVALGDPRQEHCGKQRVMVTFLFWGNLVTNLYKRIPGDRGCESKWAVSYRYCPILEMSHVQPASSAGRRGAITPPRTGGSMGSRTPLQTHRRRERGGLAKQIKKVSDDGKKTLLEAIFSKKKSANGPPSSSPNRRAPAPTPDSAALARGVEILHTIFPKWESETLQVVLEANRFIMEDTIAAVLNMEQAEHAAVRAVESKGAKNACESNRWPVKHPLPDDFLKLPDDDETVIDVPSEEGIAEEEDEECGESEKEEEGELEDKGDVETSDAVNDSRSDRSSSTFAEDDGTLYGKEFDDDRASTDGVIAPVFDDATMRANQKIVADAMNQKFLPVELRNKRPSIFDTAHIDVIKKSKLNLFEAEERIRHREPHLVFGLLSKASEIYRSGVISSHELDCLRSMILSRIQPTKMVCQLPLRLDLDDSLIFRDLFQEFVMRSASESPAKKANLPETVAIWSTLSAL
uniref:CUE domain-containing protein n=1 Tax=Hyaloperonospora arabidopsidis (strain Emoy2) TaxID=559515 RepID=M4BH70_HYAAE